MEATTTAEARAVLDNVKKTFGFTPNLFKEFVSHSPAVARVYLDGMAAMGGASLSEKEQQAVILAISSYNDCHYCTVAHSKMGVAVGLTEEETTTLVEGGLPASERLRNLTVATRRIQGKRGWMSEEDLAEFEAMGIDRGEVYEIIALIGLKTISNYVNHFAKTEIDPKLR